MTDTALYPYFIGFFSIVLTVIQLMINSKIKNNLNQINPQVSLDLSQVPIEAQNKEKDLKNRYVAVYSLARIVIWIKAPYIILNFINLGYSIYEISMLYILDLVFATIFGVILGNASDVFGRKKMCYLYFIFSAFDLTLKSFGNSAGIIVSQVLNGATTVLIHNSFESWLIIEAKREFTEYSKECLDHSLKVAFKEATIFDSISSIVCTFIAMYFYVSL